MSDVLEEINDTLMDPWGKVCKLDGIENTPLMPYMDEEQLYHKHLYLDNTKIKSAGYKLRHPKMTRTLIEEVFSKDCIICIKITLILYHCIFQIIKDFVDEKHLPSSINTSK